MILNWKYFIILNKYIYLFVYFCVCSPAVLHCCIESKSWAAAHRRWLQSSIGLVFSCVEIWAGSPDAPWGSPPFLLRFSCALILCVYLCFWTGLRYRKSDNHVVVLLPGKPTLGMFAVGWLEECVIWHIRAHSMRSTNTATNAYRHTHQHHTVR